MAGRRTRRHVVSRVSAVLLVNGPRQLLRAMRKRVVEGLSVEGDALRLTQSHADDQLEFSIDAAHGLPYPALIAASARYPDCVLTVEWDADGARGRTSIRNGEVESSEAGAAADHALTESIEVDASGARCFGLALPPESRIASQAVAGYAVTRNAETYFRISGGPHTHSLQTAAGDGRMWNEAWSVDADGAGISRAVTLPQSIGAADLLTLDDSAAGFRARWLWYDHAPLEETAIERARAGAAARAVNPINVQSRGLARLANGVSGRVAPQSQWVVALLMRSWAAADL